MIIFFVSMAHHFSEHASQAVSRESVAALIPLEKRATLAQPLSQNTPKSAQKLTGADTLHGKLRMRAFHYHRSVYPRSWPQQENDEVLVSRRSDWRRPSKNNVPTHLPCGRNGLNTQQLGGLVRVEQQKVSWEMIFSMVGFSNTFAREGLNYCGQFSRASIEDFHSSVRISGVVLPL
jgi:hypothetical protein